LPDGFLSPLDATIERLFFILRGDRVRIEKMISHDTKKKLYEKIKLEIDPEYIEERKFRETERMMGKYTNTLHRGKGGAWK
jgi:hypothetical protein